MSARAIPSVAGLRPALAGSARVAAPLTRLGAQRRWMSGPYGYTQAKALVFSEYGEPKDALRYATQQPTTFPPPLADPMSQH